MIGFNVRPMSPPKNSRRRFLSGKWAAAGAILAAVACVIYLFGKGWVREKMESTLIEQLEKRELTAEWKSSSWNLWTGLKLTGLEIRSTAGDPLAKTENLSLHVPLSQFLGSDRLASIDIRNAAVTLSDAEGSIDFEEFSLDSKFSSGVLKIKKSSAQHQGLTAKLTGEITLKSPPTDPPPPFTLDLSLVRTTLAALDFTGSEQPFEVTGSFEVDASKTGIPWRASLKGDGEKIVWKKIPLARAAAEAELSSTENRIDARLASSRGNAEGRLTRSDWKKSPFVFKGVLEDAAGKSSDFEGTYENRSFAIQHLTGSADLWEIAHDFPALAERLPKSVDFPTFPSTEIQNIKSDPETGWTVGSAKTTEPGMMAVTLKDKKIEARELSGSGSYDGQAWKLENVQADLFSGNLSVSGLYSDGALRQSTVSAKQIKLSEIKLAMGKKNPDSNPGVLAFSYKGSLDFPDRNMDGKGSMRLENAPVIEVPLLDPVYDIFAAIIPGMERPPDGRFEADFTGKSQTLQVDHFTATGGSLTVDAKGDLNLKTGKVQGTARGKLGGLPGVVTSPLSRLLEMEVTGSYDDLKAKPLNPAKILSNAATGTLDAISDAFQQTEETVDEIKDRESSDQENPKAIPQGPR